MEQTLLDFKSSTSTLNQNKYVSYIINKLNKDEYISSNSFMDEEVHVEEELTNISKEDENIVIRYILEVMRKHGIITEEEYQTVLYKYSQRSVDVYGK